MLCALCCAVTSLKADTPLNILFIGNSFTNGGPIPTVVQSIAVDAGWAGPDVTNVAVNGQSLSYHRTSATTLAAIDSGGWDYVVLQEYSTKPTDNIGPASVFKADATFLYDRVKASSPAAQIILYETWARHEDNTIYPGTFTDRTQMQTQLNFHYHDCADNYIPANSTAAVKTDVTVAPAGEAWHANYLDQNLMLHGGDLYHAGSLGQYLSSMAIYSTIYHRMVTGLSPQLGVSEADAAYLQTICDTVTGEVIPQFGSDLNGNRIVDLGDFVLFGLQWLDPNCGDCNGADFSGDSNVGMDDVVLLAERWLRDYTLKGYWKLDGDGTDSSSYGNDGTVYGTPAWNVTGKIGQSLILDGDDYVEMDVTGYKGVAGTKSRTCAAWIQTTSANGTIMDWGDSADGEKWKFYILDTFGTTGALQVEVWGGHIVGSTDLRDGNWHHVAAVLRNDGSPDVDDIEFYVDGIEEYISSVSSEAINTGGSNNVLIGAMLSGAGSPMYHFDGQIDDARIYDRGSDSREIAELAGISGLVGHWAMDDDSGSVIAGDSSGYGHDGTVYNIDPNNWVAGKVGPGAIELNGVDEYIETTGFTGITGSSSCTIAAWIKTPVTTGKAGTIACWGDPADGEKWKFQVFDTPGTAGAVQVDVWNGYIVGSTDLRDGLWHHVAAVLADDGTPDVDEVRLYVDGNEEAISSVSGQAINMGPGNDLLIGALLSGGGSPVYHFDGRIDDVRMYSIALSEAEIQNLAGMGN